MIRGRAAEPCRDTRQTAEAGCFAAKTEFPDCALSCRVKANQKKNGTVAEHPRIDLTTAEGPFVPGRYMAEKPRFRFVEPTIAPVVAPPKYREEPRLRVVAPRLGLARLSTGFAVSLGMLAVFAVIGVGGLLTRPDAPEIAALPASPPATADPRPAAPPRVALLPSLPPEALAVPPVRPAAPEAGEAPRLAAAPSGLRPTARPAALPPGQVPSALPQTGAPAEALRLVAVSPRPLPRPARDGAPAAAEESLLSALARSLRPLPRPEGIAALSIAPALIPTPAPARLAQPEVVETVSASPTLDILPPAAASGCPSSLSRGMPRRSARAETGSQLAARLSGLQGAERDRLIAAEVLNGNMPGFLRGLTPVTISGKRTDGASVSITLCVTPDYLAIGSDDDFFRVPLGLPAAAMVADRMGFLLPTTRMVDAIYEQARVRLAPQPMTPGAAMTTTRYFWAHNQTVDGQVGNRAGALTAGQKKDIVLSNRLYSNPGRIAIYGWHRTNGTPIQPLSTVHGAYYADYSHGVRLVSRTAYVNGRARPLAEILSDPAYAGILSKEGPIQAPERLMAALYR